MPARRTFTLEDLSLNIPKIFEQVQNTSANHQKNYVALYKLHLEAAKEVQSVQNGASIKLVGERAFEDTFITMLSRALPIKKGAGVADRIVRFVGGYVRFINEKATEERQKKAATDEDAEDEEDDPAARFVTRLLRFLHKGCMAKDKIVRYRVVQCISEMIAHLGELDEDAYTALREVLLERLSDKEPLVRVQAVIALSKLCGSEDPDDDVNITEMLVETMTYDTSADVRRAALTNLPPNEQVLPAMLARTRDIDPMARKLVYSNVLEQHCLVRNPAQPQTKTEEDSAIDQVMGITHPRALTIATRELIVRNGLGDREETVKAAAEKLISYWIDIIRPDSVKPEEGQSAAEADIIAFLDLFDLISNTTAEDALNCIFAKRIDLLDGLQLGDSFWEAMTPCKAFLARVFVDYCVSHNDEVRLENSLPVVTSLAFRIQAAYNDLLEELQSLEEELLLRGEIPEEREDARIDREFIIGELLRLAVNLDYADEIGRRKMFQLVRDMISQNILPEGLVSRCLDVLRKLSPNERDLIRVVVEVVHELRDNSDEDEVSKDASGVDDAETTIPDTPMTEKTVRPADKPEEEKSPEEQARADAIDMRCLSLCIGMLERVNGTFEENSTLEGLLGELIVPAVKRKEIALREKGLVSLGLCCLIARRMAINSFQLFVNQLQSAPEVLKMRVLQIVFDILMVHDSAFLSQGNTSGERLIEFLLLILDKEESDKAQALLCIGLAKLMLAGMVTDDRVLQSLILVYVSPETAKNQELRQCLSYFFPIYCYSSPANQRRMQKSFMTLFMKLTEVYREWDGDKDMISPAQTSLMFIDWTDPQKAAAIGQKVAGYQADEMIHIALATDIVKALFSNELEREDRKILCQLLGKLHLPEQVDEDKIRTLKLLINNLRSRRPLRDSTAKNAFAKFEAALTKKYEQQLADFNEEEFRQLEHLKDLFEFLDDIIPVEDDEDDPVPVRRAGRKRRSESVTSDATSTSGYSGDDRSTPPRKSNGKSKAKRRRTSNSDDESGDDTATERGSPPTARAPTRVMPRRSAADKSRVAVSKSLAPPTPTDSDEEPDESDDDDDEEDVEATPVAPKNRRPPLQPKGTREPPDPVDAHVSEMSFDSIMDESDENDDDEVDNLL